MEHPQRETTQLMAAEGAATGVTPTRTDRGTIPCHKAMGMIEPPAAQAIATAWAPCRWAMQLPTRSGVFSVIKNT